MSQLRLGERVHAADTLYRKQEGSGYMSVDKTWIRHGERSAPPGFAVNAPGARPVDGVVVGLRTLAERGTVIYSSGDDPATWKPKASRAAVLIAYDLRRAPALAWVEDVKPAAEVRSTDTNEGES